MKLGNYFKYDCKLKIAFNCIIPILELESIRSIASIFYAEGGCTIDFLKIYNSGSFSFPVQEVS